MGGIVATFRDIKTVIKDLKITLRLTAKVMLKVHTIMEDLDETVQELKKAAKFVSAKIPFQDDSPGQSKSGARNVMERVEATARSFRCTVVDAVSQVDTRGMARGTREKLKRVVQFSEAGSKTVAEIIALSNTLQEMAATRPLEKGNGMHTPAEYFSFGKPSSKDNRSEAPDFSEVTLREESVPEHLSHDTVGRIEVLDPNISVSRLEDLLFRCFARQCILEASYATYKPLPSAAKTALSCGNVVENNGTIVRMRPRTKLEPATVNLADMLCWLVMVGELVSLKGQGKPKGDKWKFELAREHLQHISGEFPNNQADIIELDRLNAYR